MKFCLIGEKLGHSFSKQIHEFCGQSYKLVEVEKEKLSDFLKNCQFDGFNVTIPYKKTVVPYLDGVSEVAKRIGAVNTVVNKNGKLYGDNTDYFGVIYAFKRMCESPLGKNVMILGTGGASQAVKVAMQDMGAKNIITVGRNSSVNYTNCYEFENTQIIVNATPVGLCFGERVSPVELNRFKNLTAVFDCVYNPITTEFIRQAKELNLKAENGLSMLVAQAVKAEQIWTGLEFDDDFIESAIANVMSNSLNIVLTGMAGAGKTTLGKLVAKELDKEFVDTDEYIFASTGKAPKDIILTDGESAFREIEVNAVKEVSAKLGVVISCGGGVVLKEQNVINLKANGQLYYVVRDLNKLSLKDRPLSAKKGVKALFEERKSVYEGTADYIINNNGEIELAVKEIIKNYETYCNKRT